MSDQSPGVSARGVLDGEAGALAGLCDSRGASVVGYCACVCGPERAVEAASAAFAAFRAGAVRAVDPLSIDPEALLLGRTRAAAAQRAPRPVDNVVYADVPCSQMPVLLAEAATGSASAADEDRLRRHLARCVACRETDDVQQQAERAYFHPMSAAVDPVSRLEIIEALRRAVPVATAASLGAPSANGDRPMSPASPEIPQASVAPAPPRIPTPLRRTVPLAGSALTSTRVGPSQAIRPPPGASPSQSTPQGSRPPQSDPLPQSSSLPARESTGGQSPAPGDAHAVGAAARGTPPSGMPNAGWDSPTGVMSAVEFDAALGYAQGGAGDPAGDPGWAGVDPALAVPADQPGWRRRRTGPLSGAGGGRVTVAPLSRAGGGRLPGARVLGPVAVLVVGLLVALFVAGVFTGGGHHASANPLSGAVTDPSTALPSNSTDTTATTGLGAGSTAGAGTTTGGGSSANGNPAALAGAATAASRAAAQKRARALARRLRAGGATRPASTKPKPTTTAQANRTAGATVPHTTPPAAATAPPAGTPPTTRPAKPAPATTKPATSGPATVHELGGGAGSAKPVTGVPATGVTGYQAG